MGLPREAGLLLTIAILAHLQSALAGAVLIGTAPIPADGTTASEVRVYVERCPANMRARVKTDAGKVSSVASGADCVVTFTWQPPAVTTPSLLPLTVQVQSDEYTVQIPVVPPFAGEITLSFEPAAIGPGETATIKVKPSGTSPIAADRRRFNLAASVGTVGSPVPLGDGTYAARYTAPKSLPGPIMVAITAADASAPAVQGIGGLPITLKKTVTLDAPVGSTSVLTLGTRQYGPFKASSKNKVSFDAELDPRYPKGRITTILADTSRTEKEVPMPSVPQEGQLVFLPMPASVVAGTSLPVRVAALGPDGKAQVVSGMQLTASGGTLAEVTPNGTVIAGTLLAPAAAQEITLGATWNGLTTNRTLKVLAPLPSMTLTAEPADLPKAGGTVKVQARVKDGSGTSVAGRAPSIVVEGAKASGKVTDNKDGSYGTSVTGSSSTQSVSVHGAPQIDVSSLAPARILAWAVSGTVLSDGKDSTSLTLVAVDAYDLPVPNVEFALAVPYGDGSLPPSVKSDARGIAHVSYRSGVTPGLQTLRIQAAGLTTELPLFQIGSRMFVTLAPGGGPDHQAALDRWRRAAPTLVIIREGVFPPSGPPVSLQMSATPGYTTPGGTIAVQVRLADEGGLGAAGQKVMVSGGAAAVGPITDSRNGSYSFTLTLPAGVDGPITVNAAAGLATASLELPTLAQASRAGGGLTATSENSSSSRASTSSAPRRANKDGPATGRFGGTIVNTRGPYVQDTDGGGGLANASTEAPDSGFFGLGLHGTYGLDAGPGRVVFGGEARFMANLYTVNANNVVLIPRDITLGGRYLHPVADNLRVGGGLDLHSLTAPYYVYADAGRTSANLAVGAWTGARLVGELDVDLPTGLHFKSELGQSFLTGPSATHLGAALDAPMGDMPVAFRAALSWDYHYLAATELGATGTVDEHVLALQLGATYVLD